MYKITFMLRGELLTKNIHLVFYCK
uniref:Uncharacterized protein n=1 Tax=Rhizophora mucronata TaxID=61149 RepID=A0A2P2MYM9_RHIMU